MKITYLGTAAAEGFPAVFCNCEFCKNARELGGKNIRTRSQSIINADLLIDLPADTYYHLLTNGIAGDSIKYLLITHSHMDHFYPSELEMRCGAYAHDMRAETLKVYCSQGAYDKVESKAQKLGNVEICPIKPFETVTLGEYTVTSLPARHYHGDGAVIYIIKGDKTLLYAHDTGYPFDEVFDYIEKEGITFDAVSLDCTNVDIPVSDNGSHMGFPNIGRALERLYNIGAVNDNTVKVVNHFSHNGNPIQEILEKRAEEYGCKVAYDSMSLNV